MNEVNISNIISTVKVMDGNALLDAKTLQKIVAAVLEAIEAREGHKARTRAERSIDSGENREV